MNSCGFSKLMLLLILMTALHVCYFQQLYWSSDKGKTFSAIQNVPGNKIKTFFWSVCHFVLQITYVQMIASYQVFTVHLPEVINM